MIETADTFTAATVRQPFQGSDVLERFDPHSLANQYAEVAAFVAHNKHDHFASLSKEGRVFPKGNYTEVVPAACPDAAPAADVGSDVWRSFFIQDAEEAIRFGAGLSNAGPGGPDPVNPGDEI